jgi:hypothetical protein
MDSETEKLRSKQEQGTQNPTGSVDVSDTKGNFSPTKESQNNPPHDISKKDPPQGADSQDQGSRKLKTRNGVLPEPTSRKRLLRVRSWHRSVQASSLFRRKNERPSSYNYGMQDSLSIRTSGPIRLSSASEVAVSSHIAAWWGEPLDLAAVDAKYDPRVDGVEPTHVFVIVGM